MLQRKVVQVKIDWIPGVFRSDVFVYKRHYTTHSEEWGDWSVVVDFTITGNTMASFLVYENAPQHLLVPRFEFGLYEGPNRVGVATVVQEISSISTNRDSYIVDIMQLLIKEQRKEVEQFILEMMDHHEQTDEEQFYIDLLNICGALK